MSVEELAESELHVGVAAVFLREPRQRARGDEGSARKDEVFDHRRRLRPRDRRHGRQDKRAVAATAEPEPTRLDARVLQLPLVDEMKAVTTLGQIAEPERRVRVVRLPVRALHPMRDAREQQRHVTGGLRGEDERCESAGLRREFLVELVPRLEVDSRREVEPRVRKELGRVVPVGLVEAVKEKLLRAEEVMPDRLRAKRLERVV